MVEPSNNTVVTCAALQSLLPANIFYPSSDTYKASVSKPFWVQSRQDPTCLFQPSNPTQVADALRLLSENPETKFAIRSGAHGQGRGFNSIADGITFDLASMNKIELTPDSLVLRIHSGATWGQVYEKLEPSGLAVLGGRDATIGAGGFVTGGGISAFSRRRGWACDSVVSFQIALASGDLVEANANVNPELFQALKGGGNNFGVVTRIDMLTHPQPPFLGGSILYPHEAEDACINAFTEFKSAKNPDLNEEVLLNFLVLQSNQLGTNSPYMTSLIVYYPDSTSNPDGLKRWQDIRPQLKSSIRASSILDFADEIDSKQSRDKFGIYMTTTFKITPTIIREVHSVWEGSVKDTFVRYPDANAVFTLQSLPAVSKTTAGLFGLENEPHPERDIVIGHMSAYWDKDGDSAVIEERVRKVISDIEDITTRQGIFINFKYPNYAAKGQDIFAGFGEGSKEFLQSVAKKYDPNGMFQKQVPGGFKLFA